MDTLGLGLDPTTLTSSLMQTLAVPLIIGTIASIAIVIVWIIAKIISAVQMRHAFSDLREIRRLLTEMNTREQARLDNEQQMSAPVAPVVMPPAPVVPQEQEQTLDA